MDLKGELGPFFNSLVDHYDQVVRTEFLARCMVRHDRAVLKHLPFIESLQDSLLAAFEIAKKLSEHYPQTALPELFAKNAVSATASLIESYLLMTQDHTTDNGPIAKQ